jgi:hypothetical protein
MIAYLVSTVVHLEFVPIINQPRQELLAVTRRSRNPTPPHKVK